MGNHHFAALKLTSQIMNLDTDREKFRRYVENTGVLSLITDLLVKLYENPERPVDPMTYIKNHFSSESADAAEIKLYMEQLKANEARQASRIKELEKENADLKAKYEPKNENANQ